MEQRKQVWISGSVADDKKWLASHKALDRGDS
jgi:hypothetical protein